MDYLTMRKLFAWSRAVLIADPDARVLWLLFRSLLFFFEERNRGNDVA
jgi:hypothetical protein